MKPYNFYGSPKGTANVVNAGSRSYFEFEYMAAKVNPSTMSPDDNEECYHVVIKGKDALPLANVIVPESILIITQSENGTKPPHLLIKVENGKLISIMTIERKQFKITKKETKK